jgi:hypothetical protein
LVAEERSSFRRGLILSRNRNFFKERKKERKNCESRGGSVGSAAQTHADLLTSVGPLHALTGRSSYWCWEVGKCCRFLAPRFWREWGKSVQAGFEEWSAARWWRDSQRSLVCGQTVCQAGQHRESGTS